ncbi:MAG: endonuclease/exonuclease/phosphatase family protein [Flavisolibacter sp.]
MKPARRKGLRIFLIVLLILIVFVFLLVALVPFLDAGSFWFIAFLGLSYPFLLLAVTLCLVISLVLRSKWFLLPLIALLLSFQQIAAIFAFRTSNEFQPDKNEETLRVLSWNVSKWSENKHSIRNRPENSFRNHMMDLVAIQNADVLCFQEFFQCYAPTLFPENIEPIKKMGYPYHYFTPSNITVNGAFQMGLMIFSRYPISDTAFFKPAANSNAEGFSFADIDFKGTRIRIFNAHLESPRINRADYIEPGKTEGAGGLMGKIKRGYALRSLQANTLKDQLAESPHPLVLCADLNDVPNSYSYFKVKGSLQDAFIQKGSGLGRTFRFISPTLRIDYILPDKNFKVLQFDKPDFLYSDHFPLVTDLVLKQSEAE